MADTIPPDNRAQGKSGHIGDHNNIADVLTALQSAVGATPTFQTGSATLVAGTVTVPNTSVLTGYVILLSRVAIGGTPGMLTYSIVSGTSFTITSTSATDTSTIAFLIVS